jgi:undecaprenyl-diphosphatase
VRSPWLDLVGSFIGTFGQAEVATGLALGIAAARLRRRSGDWVIPLFIVLTIGVEAALKIAFPHLPPPGERTRTVEILPHLQAPFTNSFPSGHLARFTFLAAVIHGVPLWLRVGAVLLMLASRLYLGEHWLSDCVGGVVLGLFVAALAKRTATVLSPA